MFNWYIKLLNYLSPSITMGSNGQWVGYDSLNNYAAQPTAAQIAQELQKLNVAKPAAIQQKPSYTPNPYTAQQLQPFNQSGLLGVQGNPYYQQYLNKMGSMGAGAGKTAPAQTTGSAK